MTNDPVRAFLVGTLASAGGLVDELPGGLEAVLPAEAARLFGVPEAIEIKLGSADASSDDGALDGRIGSTLLERLVAARLERVPVAAVLLPARLPTPLPENLPVLLNAIRVGDAERFRTIGRFLTAELRAMLHGEEVRSALVAVTLRLSDGARTEAFETTIGERIATAPLDHRERDNVAQALRNWLLREGPALHAAALESLRRRARRDLQRLAEYFASLDTEMAKAARRARSDDERVRRKAKRAALPADLVNRRDQLGVRIRPRVSARLVAATLIESDVEQFRFTVRRRSREGTVTLGCRMADGIIEGPACAACGVATLRFYLCDERLHVLCVACGQHGRLDAARCRACRAHDPESPVITVEDPTKSLRLDGTGAGPITP